MILITGGAGYIGSHTCVALIDAGYQITILDNLSNSNAAVLNRINEITNVTPNFVKGDVRDKKLLNKLFSKYDFSDVIHFAGLKAVGESNSRPLEYYDNNVLGTLELLKAMHHAEVMSFVFSSSATIYGDPSSVPIYENFPRSATNPYGQTKLMVENILIDLQIADPRWNISLLRYFNPVGAHESGLIGEDPQAVPSNLMPYISQVAIGRLDKLLVFGDDYSTPDGTGIRDYIHVVDLAEGHIAALRYMEKEKGLLTVNLGTGVGYSVLDMVKAYEHASNQVIPYKITKRRAGDVAECFASPLRAEKLLGWKSKRTLENMCADSWKWQSMNPKGYI